VNQNGRKVGFYFQPSDEMVGKLMMLIKERISA
jgi:hypothetical protein